MGPKVSTNEIIKLNESKMAISRQIRKSIIGNVGYGFYTKTPNLFHIENDGLMERINALLDSFPIKPNRLVFSSISLNFCINQLISSTTYVVEVEKEYIQPVFELLKDSFDNVVLKNPSEKEKIDYWKPNAIYVTELFKRSPINKDGSIKIEKLIVDLLFDKQIYSLFSGKDTRQAIDVLFSKYTINYKTLFSYASRKNKKKELLNIIGNYLPQEIRKIVL